MDTDLAIKVDNVSKVFRLPHEKHSSVKSALINVLRTKRGYEMQRVLDGVSFEVKKGEFFGIVGRNGSGKSTLLKLMAGIYSPTSGILSVNGKLTPFIELGVGFNPELTGRENVFLNGALLGFNRKEMNAMYDDIVGFAELEKFMDQKLKNYSSGMQVRLAFSIATRVQSDILVLDEVLAVGDAAFQRKCFDYFMHLKKINQTVVLVTHDMDTVRQYCDRALMIDSGNSVKLGNPESVAQTYLRLLTSEVKNQSDKFESNKENRWGNRKMVSTHSAVKIGKTTLEVESEFIAKQDLPGPILGFAIYGPAGNNILESNTERLKYKTKDMKSGEHVRIKWSIPNILKSGHYNLTVAACDQSKLEFYDWYNSAASFNVSKQYQSGGIVDPEVSVGGYSVYKGD